MKGGTDNEDVIYTAAHEFGYFLQIPDGYNYEDDKINKKLFAIFDYQKNIMRDARTYVANDKMIEMMLINMTRKTWLGFIEYYMVK